MCCSAVNDGSCSPWVMCSCSVMRGSQIRDTFDHGCTYFLHLIRLRTVLFIFCYLDCFYFYVKFLKRHSVRRSNVIHTAYSCYV